MVNTKWIILNTSSIVPVFVPPKDMMANADPITAMIAGWLGGGAFATVVANMVVYMALSIATSALTMMLAKKNQTGGISTEDTLTGESQPQRFIMGYYATAGQAICPPYTFDRGSKNPNDYMTYVLGWSDMPINGIDAYIIDGKEFRNPHAISNGTEGNSIPTEPGNTSPSNPMLGPIWQTPILAPSFGVELAPFRWARFHNGKQTAPDNMLLARFYNHAKYPWFATSILKDVAYSVMTFDYDSKYFSGFPKVKAVVKGISLYDPRRDSTAGGSGSHRWEDKSTWEFSDNPIVMIYNIIRGIEMPDGAVWGIGAGADELPASYWFAEMNKADEDGLQSASTDWRDDKKRYRAGYEVQIDQAPLDVINDLLAATGGKLGEMGGTYLIASGAPAASAATLTDDDILIDADMSESPFKGLQENYNYITATYPSPKKLWEESEAISLEFPDFEAEDGQRLAADLKLNSVPFPAQVQRLLRENMQDHRRQRIHTLTLPPKYFGLNLLDTITWTSAKRGYSAKAFEVQEINVDPTTLAIIVNIRERNPADYAHSPTDLNVPVYPDLENDVPVLIGLPDFAANYLPITDADGVTKKPAIKITWQVAKYEGVAYQILNASGIVSSGSTTNENLGEIVISDGLLSNTSYRVFAKPIMRGYDCQYGDYALVTTGSAYITGDDFNGGLEGFIEDQNLYLSPSGYELPPSGAFDGQQFFNRTNGRYYRWVDAESAWVLANEYELREAFEDIDEAMLVINTAANAATAAATLANTAMDMAQAAAANSENSRVAANNILNLTITARDAANGHRASAQTFMLAANVHQVAANSYKNSAEAFMISANAAQVAANSSKNLALTYANNSANSASLAAGHASNAAAFSNTSGNHALAANASYHSAQAAANASAASANASLASSTASAASANASAQSASIAQGHMLASNTSRASAQTAANTATAASSNAAASAAAALLSQQAAANSASNSAASASAASGFAASANSSSNAASQSATAASGFASAANTAAANSLAYSQQAASAANTATGAAATASSASGVSVAAKDSALKVASDLLPSTFDNDGQFWTTAISGTPSARLSSSLHVSVTFLNDEGEGRIASIPSPLSGDAHFAPTSYVNAVVGRRYRMTVRARHVGAFSGSSASSLVLLMRRMTSSFGSNGDVASKGAVFAEVNTWQTFTLEAVFSGNDPYLLPFPYVSSDNFGSGTGRSIQFSRILIEDVTESVIAANSAAAASLSESNAAAFANSAGQFALAANTAKTQAETARGQANTFSVQAANSASNSAASAAAALLSQQAAANSASLSGNSASASAGSASLANTYAGEAGTYRSEALDYRNTAARLMSGGVSRNPIFSDWTGTNPANVTVTLGTGNSIAKITTGNRYINAIRLNATGSAEGPYLTLSGANIDCGPSPKAILARLEVEVVSIPTFSTWSGYVAGLWTDNGTNRWVVKPLKDLIRNETGTIQVVECYIERPTNWVGTGAQSFLFSVGGRQSTGTGGSIIVHRMDFQEVLEGSQTEIVQRSVAELNGLQSSAIVMRAVAGNAAAGMEMVAASNVNGSASTIRMNANNILLDGSVSARKLVVTDQQNLIPDGSFNGGDLALVNSRGSTNRLAFHTSGSATGKNLLRWTRRTSDASGVDVRLHPNFMVPVVPGASYYMEANVKAVSAGTGNGVYLRAIFYEANGTTVVSTPTAGEIVNLGTTFQVLSGKVIAPATAAFAQWSIISTQAAGETVTVDIDRVVMARANAASLIVDGTILGEHVAANTIDTSHLNVGFLNGERISANYLDVDGLLTIQPQAGLRYQKRSISDDGTDGLYFGVDVSGANTRFGMAASRTSASGARQSLKVSSTTGLQLFNARHYVSGISLPVSVDRTTNLAKTALPAGITSIKIDAMGGGAAGWSMMSIYAANSGGAGGTTTIKLYDGATLKETITATGGDTSGVGKGTSPTYSVAYGLAWNGSTYARGQDGLWSNGGNSATCAFNDNSASYVATAAGVGTFGSGGGGGGAFHTNGGGSYIQRATYARGGKAGQVIITDEIDLTGYTNPMIEITIGAGGTSVATSQEGGRGGKGGAGRVTYHYRTSVDIPADVIPLKPTATGSFVTSSNGTGSFPDLGAGYWMLHRNTSGDGVGLGYVTVSPGSMSRMHETGSVTFISSQTPTYTGASGSRQVWYSFHSMGSWGA